MNAQLAELLGGGYGAPGGIWFDGMWDKPDADWKLDRAYGLIHRLQPAALVGNNHHHTPFAGEDFQMFEQDLPGENSAGFNKAGISDLPLETCETINHSWGYTRDDKDFKSTAQLIHLLVRAAGANANFLLNIGPTAEGKVQPEFVERLQAIGAWLVTHGDSIYGTRAGPISRAAGASRLRRATTSMCTSLPGRSRTWCCRPSPASRLRGTSIVTTKWS